MLADDVRIHFSESLALDEALRLGHEQEHRWDYLLGHAVSGTIVALETHSAKDDEIGELIKKRERAIVQLHPHLKIGARIEPGSGSHPGGSSSPTPNGPGGAWTKPASSS